MTVWAKHDKHVVEKFTTAEDDRVGPTVERLQHGPVDSSAEVLVYDREGRASRSIAPRAVDRIQRMLRQGSITPEMAQAALIFRQKFYVAGMSTLRAADMARIPAGYSGAKQVANSALRARETIVEVCRAIGEPALSCLWDVIGLENTIQEWMQRQSQNGRTYSADVATGILIGALGMLAKHLGLEK